MKQLLFLGSLLLMLIAGAGCHKQFTERAQSAVPVIAADSLSGGWELRQLIGCQTPNCNPNYPKGNGHTWKFADSTYQYYINHQLVSSGEFIMGKDSCMATGKFMNWFAVKKADNQYYYLEKVFFEYEGERLVMYRGVLYADGTIEKYERL